MGGDELGRQLKQRMDVAKDLIRKGNRMMNISSIPLVLGAALVVIIGHYRFHQPWPIAIGIVVGVGVFAVGLGWLIGGYLVNRRLAKLGLPMPRRRK